MGRNANRPRIRLESRDWDRVAPTWDAEIFNTLAHDRRGTIRAALKRVAAGSKSIADLGCGIGIYLPLLAQLFDEVHGFEQSKVCVAMARRKTRNSGHVAVHVASAAPRAYRGHFDAVLCVNAAIHPEKRVWNAVLRAARSLLKADGQLIVVVPAAGSAALIARAEGDARGGPPAPSAGRSRARGVVWIEGVPVKHFTRREIAGALRDLGLSVSGLRRVEYSWRSHDMVPPPSVRGLRPWDWIAVARNARSAG